MNSIIYHKRITQFLVIAKEKTIQFDDFSSIIEHMHCPKKHDLDLITFLLCIQISQLVKKM